MFSFSFVHSVVFLFAGAQDFKAGDCVTVDLHMTRNPEQKPGYTKLRKTTLTKVEMWNAGFVRTGRQLK